MKTSLKNRISFLATMASLLTLTIACGPLTETIGEESNALAPSNNNAQISVVPGNWNNNGNALGHAEIRFVKSLEGCTDFEDSGSNWNQCNPGTGDGEDVADCNKCCNEVYSACQKEVCTGDKACKTAVSQASMKCSKKCRGANTEPQQTRAGM